LKSKTVQEFKETEIGKIPVDWNIKKIENVYEIKSGLSKPREEFGFGYPFLSFTEIFHNFSLPEQLQSLVNSTDNERKTCSIERGDVFLTRTSETWDQLGMSSVALKDYKNATFNGFAKRLRPLDKKEILPEFAIYLFRSNLIQNQFLKYNSLTTRASLNATAINEVSIVIPPIQEQKEISDILLKIDHRIKNLKNQNKILEKISKSIFKSWFVDFDGVTEFEDSELGKIPKGWKLLPLGNLCKIQPGYAFKSKDFSKTGVKIIKIRNIPKLHSMIDLSIGDFISEKIFDDVDKKFHLQSGDLLIAMTGAELGKVGIIPKTSAKLLLNQRVGKIISKHSFLIYFFMNEYLIQNHFLTFSAGSSAQGNISDKDIENTLIPLPSNSNIIDNFTNENFIIFKIILNNHELIRQLFSLRDFLLEKLISGQIRI
jgi:type I restriction enzyme, S subunit